MCGFSEIGQLYRTVCMVATGLKWGWGVRGEKCCHYQYWEQALIKQASQSAIQSQLLSLTCTSSLTPVLGLLLASNIKLWLFLTEFEVKTLLSVSSCKQIYDVLLLLWGVACIFHGVCTKEKVNQAPKAQVWGHAPQEILLLRNSFISKDMEKCLVFSNLCCLCVNLWNNC